jgi:hypothetical protein
LGEKDGGRERGFVGGGGDDDDDYDNMDVDG